MPYITVDEENSGPVALYYEDHGTGTPVVLIHGWPLSGRSWERQVPALVAAGYRVITYDRRGFGDSCKPWGGYDYDTFSTDLHKLITHLHLRSAALVGFSMGGGEVARYVGTHGTEHIRKAAFVAAIPPFLLQAPDNPQGVPLNVFDGIRAGLAKDRPAFLAGFLANFYNADVLGDRISSDALRLSWNIAVGASPKATYDAVAAWGTDFRADLASFDIPTLVVHGTKDRIVPIEVSGQRTHELVAGSKFVPIQDAPHGLNWTHAEELNQALIDFLKS